MTKGTDMHTWKVFLSVIPLSTVINGCRSRQVEVKDEGVGGGFLKTLTCSESRMLRRRMRC